METLIEKIILHKKLCREQGMYANLSELFYESDIREKKSDREDYAVSLHISDQKDSATLHFSAYDESYHNKNEYNKIVWQRQANRDDLQRILDVYVALSLKVARSLRLKQEADAKEQLEKAKDTEYLKQLIGGI